MLLALLSLITSFAAHANVVGAGTETFNPTTDQLDYVTVQSTKTLAPGLFNLGLFLDYASNSLPQIDTFTTRNARFADDMAVFDVAVGLGLARNWDFGVSVPSIVEQTVDAPQIYGDFATRGRTDIAVNTKYRLTGNSGGGVAAIATVNFLQTEDDPFSGVNPGPILNLELAADQTWGKVFAAAANVGYRWRKAGTQFPNSPIDPLQNQIIGSLAASYFFESTDTKLIGEFFGAIPSESAGANLSRSLESFEALAALRHEFSETIGAQVGASTELAQGIASPDYRFYAGLTIQLGPVWKTGREKNIRSIEPSRVTFEDGTPAVSSEEAIEAARSPKTAREMNAPTSTPEEVKRVGDVLFEPGQATFTADGEAILQPIIDDLKASEWIALTIAVHGDSMGSSTDVMDLTQARANAIKSYFTEKRIPQEKMKAVGYGASVPVVSNGNYQGRRYNRRVEFLIDRK